MNTQNVRKGTNIGYREIGEVDIHQRVHTLHANQDKYEGHVAQDPEYCYRWNGKAHLELFYRT